MIRRIPSLARGVGASHRAMVTMPEITDGVQFDTIAREWRLKWENKECLAEVQKVLDTHKSELKSLSGLKSVQRIVCGGCQDFKVITALEHAKFNAWAEAGFTPESKYLEAVKKIEGVSVVETQTYTLMPVEI
eukprot:CAMPEP_0197517134 /NCGR_PEP_ID=MMETSP1318-20131121/2107_1 /TAXON_ID=552666 /ORGANISM="Partenskyella glossopodia, Strain RCC365" /LENGTH=132 /DNA_ID=CAMNT_0043066449 /DNA_START=1 /DNA_END=399 /DNA_ORIENTATION=-